MQCICCNCHQLSTGSTELPGLVLMWWLLGVAMVTHQEDGVLAILDVHIYTIYTFTTIASGSDLALIYNTREHEYIQLKVPPKKPFHGIRAHRVFLHDDWTRLPRSIYHQRIRAHLDPRRRSFRGALNWCPGFRIHWCSPTTRTIKK